MTNCIDDMRKEVEKYHSQWLQESIKTAAASGIDVRCPRLAGHQQNRENGFYS